MDDEKAWRALVFLLKGLSLEIESIVVVLLTFVTIELFWPQGNEHNEPLQ